MWNPLPCPTTRPRLRAAAVLVISCGLAGCQAAYFLTTDETKKIKAEYGKISNQKVAVVVWADRATLDLDPQARRRVCKAVTYYLRKHLSQADFVSPDTVAEFQDRPGKDWEGLSVDDLCKHFESDLILRLDLLEYTTRASDTTELRKGRVRATVNLYECGAGRTQDAAYETEVVATYPPQSIHGTSDMEDSDLLHETTEHFAEMVASKFYDHEESLRGPSPR